AEAALRGFDEAREQVLLNVARNYLALQGLEGLLEAAREAEKVALRREQDARARIAAGTDVEIALLRAQTETARARAQIANIQGQKDATLPVLEALVGEPIDPQPARVEDFGPIGEENASPWENAYSVQSAMATTNAAQKSVRLAQFLWLPTVAGVATSLDVFVADQEKFAAQSAAAQARSQLEIRRAELAASAGRLYEASR